MSGPWAICDICGFRVRHYACRTNWQGLFVCEKDFDPRPPFLDPPRVNPMEGAPIKDARVDNTNYTFASTTEPDENDL